jgi:AmiR/NasT family two-component response regulator
VEAYQLAPALQIAWARFQELKGLETENATLRQTLQNRKTIERAKGVLMTKKRLSEAEAFRRIQRGAMDRRMPMVDLAQQILDGRALDI